MTPRSPERDRIPGLLDSQSFQILVQQELPYRLLLVNPGRYNEISQNRGQGRENFAPRDHPAVTFLHRCCSRASASRRASRLGLTGCPVKQGPILNFLRDKFQLALRPEPLLE
ncbi:hypothetical protein D3C85_1526680 [compost metagenome]